MIDRNLQPFFDWTQTYWTIFGAIWNISCQENRRCKWLRLKSDRRAVRRNKAIATATNPPAMQWPMSQRTGEGMLQKTPEKSMDFEFNLLAGDMWPEIHRQRGPKGVVEWLPLSWSLHVCICSWMQKSVELQYMCAGYINFVQLGYDHPYNEETSEEFWPMMPWCPCFFPPQQYNQIPGVVWGQPGDPLRLLMACVSSGTKRKTMSQNRHQSHEAPWHREKYRYFSWMPLCTDRTNPVLSQLIPIFCGRLKQKRAHSR